MDQNGTRWIHFTVKGSGCIEPDQVMWYEKTSQKYKEKFGKTLPSLAFFHIPLQEYMFMWNQETCYGTNNDSVSCQALNTGIFAAFTACGDVQGR